MLVQGCRENNAFAQKLLYDRYAETMMVLCLRYITNMHDAREVLMDGFCNCFKNINRFSWQGDGSLRAWLKKIMVNQCLMHLRKKSLDYREISEAEKTEVLGSNDETPLDKLSAKEIMQLVQELPAGYRTVFNLYAFEEMTHKDIAAMLGISENTSKSQLHKARSFLQKRIVELHKTGI